MFSLLIKYSFDLGQKPRTFANLLYYGKHVHRISRKFNSPLLCMQYSKAQAGTSEFTVQ